jgi:hypothetical protein
VHGDVLGRRPGSGGPSRCPARLPVRAACRARGQQCSTVITTTRPQTSAA